jgi:GTP-binding protein HflX
VVLSKRRVLLTDTVGFIDRLPLTLIQAFRSTLEETILSDFILLVVDASESDEDIERKLSCCLDTIQKIGAAGIPIVTAFNKIDLLQDNEIQRKTEVLKDVAPNPVFISALHGTNTNLLKQEMISRLESYVHGSFSLPITDESMSFVSWLFDRADVRDVKYEGDSMNVIFESIPFFAERVRGHVEQLGGTFNA